MAGLGKYKKGAAFTLKSGNKPTFVQMGSSPANMNNFGVGQGGSPYKEHEDGHVEDAVVDPKATKDKESKVNEQGGDNDKEDKAWVKALKIGTTLLSGGIQGVYGGKREIPKINYGKKAAKVTETPANGVKTSVSDKIDKKVNINNVNKIVDGEKTSKTT